jgi:hypothetical protein
MLLRTTSLQYAARHAQYFKHLPRRFDDAQITKFLLSCEFVLHRRLCAIHSSKPPRIYLVAKGPATTYFVLRLGIDWIGALERSILNGWVGF